MQAEKDKVVTLDYELTDDDGRTIDRSDEGNFAYLHGANNIIPGLEQALEGKGKDDELSVKLEPSQAYGEKDLGKIQRVPRKMFPDDIEIQAGMQFQAQGPDGQGLLVTVAGVEQDDVIVDGNHPLAGQTLHFAVKVLDVREATQEELDHGHVHGAQGHAH